MSVLSDVFSVEEIARAAGVPRDAVDAVIKAGVTRPLPGTAFFDASEAIRAGIEARRAIVSRFEPGRDPADIFTTAERTFFSDRRTGLPSFASSLVHGAFVFTMLWLTSGAPESAPADGPAPRLVFLVQPGPGGGGGGGGLRDPLPPRKAETASRFNRPRPAVDASPNKTPVKAKTPDVRPPTPSPAPAPTPVVQDPLPSRRLVAPVSPTTSAGQRDGALQPRNESTSLGSGVGGGTGTGRGSGDGEGLGAGIGPGSGGGTGGGPYRAGSGVEPPRLLREVKAKYTDDARRKGTTGNVILEIVINRDGSVGDVSVRRGLGAGLDERAVEAVRQWKFAPARRLGEPVDVIVEVAVEFMLR
jgi:TonB family protein